MVDLLARLQEIMHVIVPTSKEDNVEDWYRLILAAQDALENHGDNVTLPHAIDKVGPADETRAQDLKPKVFAAACPSILTAVAHIIAVPMQLALPMFGHVLHMHFDCSIVAVQCNLASGCDVPEALLAYRCRSRKSVTPLCLVDTFVEETGHMLTGQHLRV